MNCPICSVTLQIAERQGVEIDFCHQDKHQDSHHGEYRPHKKKGFLHDLFD